MAQSDFECECCGRHASEETMIELDNEYVGTFRGCKTISQLDTCYEKKYDEARDFCVNDPELLERVARDITEAYSKRRRELEQKLWEHDRDGFRKLLSICRTSNELSIIFSEVRTKMIQVSQGDAWTTNRILTTLEEAMKERETQLQSEPIV